jgi:hypothetical protein
LKWDLRQRFPVRAMFGVLPPRFEKQLVEQKEKIWELSGLFEMYGPLGDNFTGKAEGEELIKELVGHSVRSLALEMEDLEISNELGRQVGRPRNWLIPELAQRLLSLFLRYRDSAGRHSVLTSIDGKFAQMEGGPLFEFFKAAIEPLNQYWVTELHRKALSPARLARTALEQRRRNMRATRRRLAGGKATTSINIEE